jgi:SAM-dependent methyltransferase
VIRERRGIEQSVSDAGAATPTHRRAQPPPAAGDAPASAEEIVARYYDLEHDSLVADAVLYCELARESGGSVLELGCGTGRILLALSRAGHRAVGLDVSATMLARAEAKLRGRDDLRGAWRLVQADARHFELDERFALILAPLDFLGYFATMEDQLAVLAAARRHLGAGGRLVLDVAFPGVSFYTQPDGVLVLQWTRALPSGEDVTKWWVRELDPGRQVLHLNALYDVRAADGNVRRWAYPLDLRYYHRFELELLLARSGFRVESVFGSYAMDDLRADSARLLLIAAAAE